MHKPPERDEFQHERRSSDPLMRVMIALKDSLDAKHPENVVHMQTIEDKVDQVLAGFPDGDPVGHRKYHEAMIKKAEERALFWQELRVALATKGVVAVAGIVLFALWLYFKEEVKK